jgi:hypothetical protein
MGDAGFCPTKFISKFSQRLSKKIQISRNPKKEQKAGDKNLIFFLEL